MPDRGDDKQLNVRVNRLVADWVEFAAAERGVTQAWLVERLLMECSERMRPLSEWRLTYTPEEVAARKVDASYRAGAGLPPVPPGQPGWVHGTGGFPPQQDADRG